MLCSLKDIQSSHVALKSFKTVDSFKRFAATWREFPYLSSSDSTPGLFLKTYC